ncbi:MAG: ABC transporter permease [Anaerolineales bacterium]|nr:MAG: ABC transporter permease [Anaerolineales bacterium]
MANYVIRRLLLFIPMLAGLSILTFALIQLPPGDYLTSVIMALAQSGEEIDEALITNLKHRYGLDKPLYAQYFRWIGNILLRGDFGVSFRWNKPVSELIWERLAWTVGISLGSLLFTWLVAFPIGIYSATHQYSIPDYLFTFFGFVGTATPSFLLALILMWIGYSLFGLSIGGLFSAQYEKVPWSTAKFLDLLKHLWVPLVVLGTSGTAGLIRTLRANLLDELHKAYVVTARAKGLSETRVIWKYPVRIALNPFISGIGSTLPYLISGAGIVSIVLNLPTTGPLLINALLAQDMYLAGSFIMMLTILSLTGTLVSDILLAILDPRIRQA